MLLLILSVNKITGKPRHLYLNSRTGHDRFQMNRRGKGKASGIQSAFFEKININEKKILTYIISLI